MRPAETISHKIFAIKPQPGDACGRITIEGLRVTQNGEAAIRADDVRRHYVMGTSTILAVDGITLEVRAGEFVALLGSSGSGKSTLLNLIAGLDRPSSGAIRVLGRDLAQMDAEELARYRRHTVGMVFQSFNLIPTMTLEENVVLPARFAEVERGARED